MSSDVLIRVEHVQKKFCRSLKKSLWYGVQDICSDLNPFVRKVKFPLRLDSLRPPNENGIKVEGAGRIEGWGQVSNPYSLLRQDEFWAVNDVSFELRRGECLGLIGRNGAGKTTLLKMLNGLIKPDAGRIEMRGRIGALIALGAGFNPILTGRENIYVNASVLGLKKKEIDEKIEDIIDFADIGDFIDTPVQSYSSGMQVRLGFAIATALKPDVLILDEVLAVGDAAFRHKCYHRINKLLKNAAVIFVSHSMDYVAQISTETMMMRRGTGEWFADPIEGVAAYSKDNESGSFTSDGGRVEAIYPPIRSVEVRLPEQPIRYGTALPVEITIDSDEDINGLALSFTAVNRAEQPVMHWVTGRDTKHISLHRGRQIVRFSIAPLLLHPGTYAWDLGALRLGSIDHIIWFMHAGTFVVAGDFQSGDIPYLPTARDFQVISVPTFEAVSTSKQ